MSNIIDCLLLAKTKIQSKKRLAMSAQVYNALLDDVFSDAHFDDLIDTPCGLILGISPF